MKLYSCKVRLHGEVKDEVLKSDVTAAEIRVLRHVHGGDDAVVDIAENGACDRNEVQERDRLAKRYGEKTVAELFGAPTVEISTELPTDVSELPPEPVVERKRKPHAIDTLTE